MTDNSTIGSHLADYRRLYHHMVNDGQWHNRIDTRRLGNMIADIERLADENKRLTDVVDNAPHDLQCVKGKKVGRLFGGGYSILKCDCWKAGDQE